MLKIMDPASIKKIKIGVLSNSSFLEVSDSVKRAMKMAEMALTKIGFEVVHVNIP